MGTNRSVIHALLLRLLPLAIFGLAAATAAAQTDPPARVGNLSQIEGSVALAPAGDTEWTDAVLNRPVTRGDRLWTDHGSRAEVHLGSAVLHLDGETFLDVTALDDQVLQASLNEGTVNARVRELVAGENFEIDTPQLAFRASRPGDYRIDVEPASGTTRVTVHSGAALVYGASGEAQELQAGQQVAFAGRNLERVAVQAPAGHDAFDRWAADRNRLEDESVAARYLPREVVGYQQLDPYGTWAQDPGYGAIWYPRITIADWAPYRYGHWEWIVPWGWTWIDDAPWGFAPFHYGRWARIGSRWAWVPGRIGRRPVYAPALVVFVGGGSRTNWNFSVGSSPGIAWYPLAPGEAWRPTYRTSPLYVRNVNRNIAANQAAFDAARTFRDRGEAVTAVKVDDFSRGRPVHRHWSRVNPAEIARAPVATPQTLPEPPRLADAGRAAGSRRPAPSQSAPVIGRGPQPQFAAPGLLERPGERGRPFVRPPEQTAAQPPHRREEQQRAAPQPLPPGQVRADEQRRQQVQQLQLHEQERARRDQQVQQERALRDRQVQLQAQRQLEEQRRGQQIQLQREHAVRQQQEAAQERIQRQQQAEQVRQARQQQAAQERLARQQQAAQERQQLQLQQQQQRAPQRAQPPLGAAAPIMPPGLAQRGEGRERAAERGRAGHEPRGEARSQGDEEGARGRGHGRGG